MGIEKSLLGCLKVYHQTFLQFIETLCWLWQRHRGRENRSAQLRFLLYSVSMAANGAHWQVDINVHNESSPRGAEEPS
jgi:hypothetical protein